MFRDSNHICCTAVIGLLLTTVCPLKVQAVIWADKAAKPPTTQVGPFKHAGRMLYTRFEVFGGSCVWIGGQWVLTARHGVSSWSAGSLKLEFPAHGKQRYAVQRIHLPIDKQVDLALLELKKSLEFKDPVTLYAPELTAGASVRFGGYGSYGSAGDIAGSGRFHLGTNRLDQADAKLARFSLDKATQAEPREALPAMFDSGSPLFLVKDDREVLAGIVIRVSNSLNPRVGDRAVATSLAGQVKWIREIATDVQWLKK